MNKVILSGRIVKEPEIRITPNGTEVLQNSIAVKRNYKNAQGQTEVDFINVVMFGTVAKYIGDYAPKGSLIEVEGRWQSRTYQDNQGNTRRVDECVVDNASILIRNEQQEQYQAPQRQYQQKQQPNPRYEDPFANANNVEEDLPF